MSAPSIHRALAAAEDLAAERAALGAALQGWAELESVRAELPDGAAEFSRPLHAAVFSALCALAAAPDRPEAGPDGALLLSKARELAGGVKVGVAELADLLAACPSRLNARQYAAAVHAAHAKRAALAALDRAARDIAAGRGAELVIGRATQALAALHPNGAPDRSAAPLAETWRTFPLEALPPRMREFVGAAATATNTDPSYAALAALVTAAGCIGNRAAALVRGGWTEPAVLWGAIVGRSGTTKSPVLKLVTRPLVSRLVAERREHAEAAKAHSEEMARWEVELAAWKREARERGLRVVPPPPPTAPVARRLLVSDITLEKLGELLGGNPLGLLVVRDELAAWAGSFDRYAAGGKGSDQPAWLSFFDAAPVTIDRKSSGSIFIERAAVSVLGSIQPGTLERLFGAAEREAGLLARLLLVHPPERPATWTSAGLDDAVAARWGELLEALLALPPGADEAGEPKPRFLPIGRDAKPLFVAWHDAHARELVDLDNDDLRAHFAKLKGVCVRLALVFECVETASGGAAAAYIGADAMRRAIEATDWLKHEARRVYGELAETDGDRARRRLVEWIERRGGSVTVRELARGPREYRDSGRAAEALAQLVAAGLGRWVFDAGGPNGGRPADRFRLVSAGGDGGDGDETPKNAGVRVGSVTVASVAADSRGPAPDDDWGEL